MAGTDSFGIVSAKSILALELMETFNNYAKKNGTVSFPDVGKDFPYGKLDHALGAPSFEIEWVRFCILYSNH